MCAQVPGVVTVTFLAVWDEPDQQLVLYLPKQRNPTAWITALRYKGLYLLLLVIKIGKDIHISGSINKNLCKLVEILTEEF